MGISDPLFTDEERDLAVHKEMGSGWRSSPVVENTCCRFLYKHSWWLMTIQNCSSGDLMPSFEQCGDQTHRSYMCTHTSQTLKQILKKIQGQDSIGSRFKAPWGAGWSGQASRVCICSYQTISAILSFLSPVSPTGSWQSLL